MTSVAYDPIDVAAPFRKRSKVLEIKKPETAGFFM